MRRSRSGVGGKLKGLRRFRQDGVYYVYHRATGTRLPSDIPETDPKFLSAYLKAEKSEGSSPKRKAAPRTGTVPAVWRNFNKSDSFTSLSKGYQDGLQRHADAILATGGTVPIIQIQVKHLRKDMAGLTTNQARMRLKTWRAMMAHAVEDGEIVDDPSRLVRQRKAKKPVKHAPWSRGDVAEFRQTWAIGTTQRLAFEIVHYSGARVCDCVRLVSGMVTDDGWLSFTQQKTGGTVLIPIERAVPDFVCPDELEQLNRALDARTERHLTWLTTIHGSARSEKSTSNWFSAACRKASLKDKKRRTAHG